MNFQVARYAIRAYIIPRGKGTYRVQVHADPLNEGGAPFDKVVTCDPCSYEEARSSCYQMVAQLAQTIKAQGALVADVMIVDADTP